MSRIHDELKRIESERQAEVDKTPAEAESAATPSIYVPQRSYMPVLPATTVPFSDVVQVEPSEDVAYRTSAAGHVVPAVAAPELSVSSIALGRDLYEQLLFESLIPAFDNVPLRRIFPFVLYTPNNVADFAAPLIIRASGCGVVHNYPFLKGSGLSRLLLQARTHQTRIQHEYGQVQVVEELVERLKIFDPKTVNVHIYLGNPFANSKSPEWTSKFKELSEALKNTLLIAAGCAVLFGGTLIHSKDNAESQKPREISITQLDRETQLKILPKILEAEKAEDFPEIIESLHTKQPSAERPAVNVPRKRGRK
jgi:hypothetical protein